MNFLSETTKNERKGAVKELLAENKNITMWQAASLLTDHKSFRGSITGINNYLRLNLSDLFVLRKIEPDRRKKAVELLIAKKTGITMWRAAKELAGHDGFTRNVQSVCQYIHKNFSGLFVNAAGDSNKRQVRRGKTETRQLHPKEVVMPNGSDEMEMFLGTCQSLLNLPTIGTDELTAIRVLFGLVREKYHAVMQTRTTSKEREAEIRVLVCREDRDGFKRMRKWVEDSLNEYKITNLTGDYMHFINSMMNSYGYSGLEDPDEIGERISGAISRQAARNNGVPR